ncbi:MAG: hypothetical protein RLZZ324_1293 [Candidatus Parcubacteria bacterium]|jgi:glycerophosphoryl diester phosphodiesterase
MIDGSVSYGYVVSGPIRKEATDMGFHSELSHHPDLTTAAARVTDALIRQDAAKDDKILISFFRLAIAHRHTDELITTLRTIQRTCLTCMSQADVTALNHLFDFTRKDAGAMEWDALNLGVLEALSMKAQGDTARRRSDEQRLLRE